MKKIYLLLILLSPLFAMAQPPRDLTDNRPPLFLGISLNNTITGVANYDGASYSQTSFYIFPEVHFGTNFLLKKNVPNLLFRLEATATFDRVSYSTSTYNPASTGYNVYYIKAYKVNEFAMSINPQLLYKFYNNSGVARFYGSAGLAISGISAGLNVTETTQPVSVGASFVNGTSYDLEGWYSFAATFKLGYTINEKWDIYAGCNKAFFVPGERSFENSPYDYDPAQTAKQIIFNVGINRTFGRK